MSDLDQPKKSTDGSRFRSFVELTSFLGSIGFVMSAIVNEFVFRQWGLSYLAICSVQDVVLGGVQLLIMAILALPLVVIMLMLLAMFTSGLASNWRAGLRWLNLVPIATLILTIAVLAWLVPPTRVGALPWGVISFVPAFLAWIVGESIASGFAPGADWRTAWQSSNGFTSKHPKMTGFLVVSLMALAGAVMIYQAMMLDLAYGRGVLTKTPNFPPALAAQCSGRDVVWIGSDRLLVRCGASLILLQDKTNADIVLAARSYPFFTALR
jgi:hypothetical protein